MSSLAGLPNRVLVTGGGGFLGQHVVRTLRSRGVDVLAPNRRAMCCLNGDQTRAVVVEYAPAAIVHLAAYCGGIGKNAIDPCRMLSDNFAMGANVLKAAVGTGAKVVLLGSVCGYPRDCQIPFRECDLWAGFPEKTNAPYGVAKRAVFTLAEAYHRQYGLNVACLLPANLYGPGDHFDDAEGSHVIPALIARMQIARDACAESVTLWGTGRPTRDFLYVTDCVEAIVAATINATSAAPINIGCGVESSISDVADRIKRLVGYGGRVLWDAAKPDGQPRRRLDITRARALLGWNPTVDLEEGLRRTVESYDARISVLAAT